MIKAGFLVLILTLTLTPVFAADVTVKHDDFYQTTIYDMTNNNLSGSGLLSSKLSLQARSVLFDDTTKQPLHFLILKYTNVDWLFIEKMIIKIDGEIIRLNHSGTPNRQVQGGGKIQEIIFFDTELDFLDRIANAQEIEVRAEGHQYYTDKKFKKANFDNFKKFVEKVQIGVAQKENNSDSISSKEEGE